MGWFMLLAAWPDSFFFRCGGRPSFSLRLLQSTTEIVASMGIAQNPADFQQNFSWAAHGRRFVRPSHGHCQGTLAQQQLGGDHRRFRLAMDQLHRACTEPNFFQRAFVGAKEAFVFPTPTIEFGRNFDTQAPTILHVGKQPHVDFVATIPSRKRVSRVSCSV